MAALASALVLALLPTACGNDDDDPASGGGGGDSSSAARDTIRFGTDPTYPPLDFKEGSDVTGAEIEIMEAVAEDLGAEASWVTGDFASLISSLKAKRFDVMAAGMFDASDRVPDMIFVDYLDDPGFGALFRAEDAPPDDDPKHLCDLTIAAGKGTGVVDSEAPKLPALTKDICPKPVKTILLPNEAGAQLAVQSGRADAFMTSYMSVNHIARTAGGGNQFKAIEYPDAEGKNIIAVGTRRSDRELANQIRASIDKLMENGKYREILEKYGIEDMALDRTMINMKP